MDYNSKLGYSGNEQDYQLTKTSLSNISKSIAKLDKQKEVLRYLINVLPESTDTVTLENPTAVKSVKAQLFNKNLIPYPYLISSQEINGLTVTVNNDGTITVNGTATSGGYLELAYVNLEKGKQYTFSGCPEGGAAYSTYWLGLSTYQKDSGSGVTFTTSSNMSIPVMLNVASGTTLNNLVFKPKLEIGSTATPYITDFSTVKVITYGKNLISYPYYTPNGKINGITFTASDTGITVRGTSTAATTFYLASASMNLKKGITYTLSVTGDYAVDGITYLFINSSTQGTTAEIPLNSSNKVTFTPTTDITNTSCYVAVSSGVTVSGTMKIQLETGSTDTEYEPYQGQIYTPTTSGEVTGITVLTPITTITTNNSNVIFTKIIGDNFNYII